MSQPDLLQSSFEPAELNQVGMRTTPRQARAAETVHRLLTTSAELIEERGIDGFNTNLLAERCGVRVRSVYRYFDNKQAIVATLYRQMTEEWHPFFEERFRRMGDPSRDWREEADSIGWDFEALLRGSPAAVAIRRAMKSDATLIEIERADNAFVAQRFAAAISHRAPDVELDRLERVGRTWLNAVSILIDIALDCESEEQTKQLEETAILQRAYLGTVFD